MKALFIHTSSTPCYPAHRYHERFVTRKRPALSKAHREIYRMQPLHIRVSDTSSKTPEHL